MLWLQIKDKTYAFRFIMQPLRLSSSSSLSPFSSSVEHFLDPIHPFHNHNRIFNNSLILSIQDQHGERDRRNGRPSIKISALSIKCLARHGIHTNVTIVSIHSPSLGYGLHFQNTDHPILLYRNIQDKSKEFDGL